MRGYLVLMPERLNHLINSVFIYLSTYCYLKLCQILWTKENKNKKNIVIFVKDLIAYLGKYAIYTGTVWVWHNISNLSLALLLPGSSHPSFAKFCWFYLLGTSWFYLFISILTACVLTNFLISYCPGYCKMPTSENDHFIDHFFWFIVFQKCNFPISLKSAI